VVTILVNTYKSIMKFIFPPFEGKQMKKKLFGRKSNKILISNTDVDLNNDTDMNSEYKSNDLDLDSKSVQTIRTKPRAIMSDSSQVSSSKNIFPDERHHHIVEQNYYKTNSINGPSEELDSMSALSISTMHSHSNSMFKPRASINSNGAKVKLQPINLDSNSPSRKIRQETNNLIIESIHEMSSIIENEIDNFSVEVSKRKKKKSRTRNYDETRNNVNTKNIKPPAYRPLSAKKRLTRRPSSGPGERYEIKEESENESETKDNDSIFPLWH